MLPKNFPTASPDKFIVLYFAFKSSFDCKWILVEGMDLFFEWAEFYFVYLKNNL